MNPLWSSSYSFYSDAPQKPKSVATEFAGGGFAVGVVRGARSFKVDELGRLTGIHYPQVWRPGENVFECRATVVVQTPQDATVTIPKVTKPDKKRRRFSVYDELSITYDRLLAEMIVKEQRVPRTDKHPMTDCKCGFYAYYDGSDDYYQEGYVSGVMEGYGETLIGTRGFRCAKARIVALFVPAEQDRFASRISRNYAGVPMFGRFADMVAEFPPDGGEAGVSPDNDDFWTRAV